MTKAKTTPHFGKSHEDEDFVDLSFLLNDPERKISPARYPDFETGQVLRRGWVHVPIDMVVRLRSEKADPRVEGHLQFVGMDDIQADGLTIAQTRPFAEMKSLANRFRAGDMLYGRLRPYLNKTAVVDQEGACSGELLVLTPSEAIIVRYLQYFMHSQRYVGWISAAVSGDRPRVGFETLARFAIPLPPLAEQRRIVARIDALFAEIAEGEAALAAARKGLDTFRRALLKAAVTGELTKDWGATNLVSESGHDLLARATKARTKKVRGRRSSDTLLLGMAVPRVIPDGWAWTPLGELLSHLTSGSRDWAEYYDRGSKIFVMAQNVRSGRYNHSYVKYVDPPSHLKDVERSRVQRDDLLVTIVGANTGDVCRIDFDAKEYFVCQSVALMRPALPQISAYLEMYLGAPDGGRVQMDKVIYGAGRPHLSFDQIESFAIPIPPFPEMEEILRRASDALTAIADTLAMLEAEAADAARLKQSILKAAFEGRLVSQDPADEPASALLAGLAVDPPASRAERERARKSAS